MTKKKEWTKDELADLSRRRAAACKKYEKTRKGFLMRAHRNMRSRVLGIQKAKHHLYRHIDSVVDRSEFYEWALSSHVYNSLFDAWVASGYDRRLTPSVDRIDSSLGYSFDNMEWVTHSENSRRSSIRKTSLTKESVARVRKLWALGSDGGKKLNRAALAREIGVSYPTMLRALDDDYVKMKGLI